MIETTFTELPSRRKDSKKKKMSLLAKLKNLTELCYIIKVKEEQTLDEITSLVDETLSVAREKLEAGSEGLVEQNTETTHVKQTESTTKDYVVKGDLPLPRQPTKHLASGRVGATADMKRQWYQVKIKLDEINETKSKMADIPICSKKNETKIDWSKGFEITVVKPPKNIERQIYIKYNQEIKKEILGGNCLSDMTINLAQSILHQQFRSVLGLEHTELGLTNMFTVRKNSFLQILYGNYHWVTVFGNEKGEISFYDSLSNGNIPRVFLHQICNITQPATNTISVKVQPVQQQSNQVDCGVFSIAFAVTLSLGDNPALVTYEQTMFRFHLNKCLKLGKFSLCPVINGKRQKRGKEIAITKDVYCTCRRTYFQEDTEESPYNFMAPCCICEICIIKSA